MLLQMLLAQLVQRQGNNRSADECDQRQRNRMIRPSLVAALAARKALDERNNAPKIKKDEGEDGPGLDDDRVHLPVRIIERDAHRGFGNAQMRSRTDRQKFGQALNNAQKKRLNIDVQKASALDPKVDTGGTVPELRSIPCRCRKPRCPDPI